MSKLYMQFSNCIPVRGFGRSVLYDVQKTRYLLIENEFADLLIRNKNKIELDTSNDETRFFFEKLVKDEWGVITSKSIASRFPELNLQWDHYAEITNAQIDFGKLNNGFDDFFLNILPQFDALSCKSFQINFLETMTIKHCINF